MDKFISVFVTTVSQEEAEKITFAALEDKIAVCANIIPGVKSIYPWKGKIEHTEEHILILKTKADLFDVLQKKIKDIHSYECPCIIAWPIAAGSVDYLKWLSDYLN